MAIASAKGKLIAVIGDEVNFHIFFVLFCLLFLYTMLFFLLNRSTAPGPKLHGVRIVLRDFQLHYISQDCYQLESYNCTVVT